jgi:hypothetical protein
MKFLWLCLLVTGVLSAVSQHCVGFEDSEKPRELIVEVGSDTSVLLYHLIDVASSNIPFDINDEILQLEPNGFGICTQEKSSKGLCDTVGTFCLKFDATHHDLINKLAHAGEKVSLTISEEGLYCAVIYQEGAALSHVKVVEKHSYGYLPLPLYATKGVLYLLNSLLLTTYSVLEYAFKDKIKAYNGAISPDISRLILAKKFQLTLKSLSLSIQNSLETHGAQQYVNISTAIDTIYMAITFVLYYKSSAGIFGFHKNNTDVMNVQSFSKSCLLLMIFSGILVSFQPILHKIFPQQLLMITRFFSQIVLSTVWIPMVYILWKNSSATQKDTEDPIFAKKYYRSKLCLFWIPITTSIISLAGVMVVMSTTSKDAHSVNFSNCMQKISFLSMESSLNQNNLFVLLKYLPEFSMLFVFWAMLLIWRPSMIKKTDLESTHNNEIVEEIKEEKL